MGGIRLRRPAPVHRALRIELPGATAGNWLVRNIVGGWTVAAFHEWQSGQPFGIRTGVDTVGQGATNNARPDWNPARTFQNDPVSGDLRTFTAPLAGGAFVTPLGTNGLPLANSSVRGGNLGRNTFRGPAYRQTNLNISKRFRFTERWSLELRDDFINAFNQHNFGNPQASMAASNFGQNTSDPGNRLMLLSAKIRF